MVQVKKSLVVLNGFIHDFAAGYWLAAIIAIAVLHDMHGRQPMVTGILNQLEHLFFWQSVAAGVIIMATGSGRTFTYVDNYYGVDSERTRRRMLLVKHIILFIAFGIGYWFVFDMTFH
ncbi:hypothetical protein Geob_3340 [Geotalea daltonii FRC-32]|uniref:Uncharacterized protein n=1 Tax=Geotalea daltonii (strain DSM 22248 / JCM 15807 / FRC-32) TaxID=316067 RepID=B9M4Z9_GEODF|nr:hypothetical protein [Geotalea daltonii]ACM21683.1 hypothetical protein Geob_3340 [Geotalea daltonii FRC-32]